MEVIMRPIEKKSLAMIDHLNEMKNKLTLKVIPVELIKEYNNLIKVIDFEIASINTIVYENNIQFLFECEKYILNFDKEYDILWKKLHDAATK